MFISHKIPALGADVFITIELNIYMFFKAYWTSISISLNVFLRFLLFYRAPFVLQGHGTVVYFLVLLQYFKSILIYECFVV